MPAVCRLSLRDALRLALNGSLLVEVGPQGVENPLLHLGRLLLRGDHFAFEKPLRQKCGGTLQRLLSSGHKRATISRTRQLDNVLERPLLRFEMIVVMKAGAVKADVDGVLAEIQRLGYRPHPIYGVERTVIGCHWR